MKSVLAVFLSSFGLVSIASRIEVEPEDPGRASFRVQECTGCFGSKTGPYSNSSCITIVATDASVGSGTCTGTTSPCSETPCAMSGTFQVTIASGSACTVYRRGRINDQCIPGTEVYSPGSTDTFHYDDQTLDCGTSLFELFYITDPGNSCNLNAAAGWGFTCTDCVLTHG